MATKPPTRIFCVILYVYCNSFISHYWCLGPRLQDQQEDTTGSNVSKNATNVVTCLLTQVCFSSIVIIDVWQQSSTTIINTNYKIQLLKKNNNNNNNTKHNKTWCLIPAMTWFQSLFAEDANTKPRTPEEQSSSAHRCALPHWWGMGGMIYGHPGQLHWGNPQAGGTSEEVVLSNLDE